VRAPTPPASPSSTATPRPARWPRRIGLRPPQVSKTVMRRFGAAWVRIPPPPLTPKKRLETARFQPKQRVVLGCHGVTDAARPGRT